ncbi:MAG: prepilin-type N-terminal cleavage/methylation domain-containing protein [Candidatus Omnitrophica bacterium]|nr:prepilin-type N-terminal cleavage/methylation domain-containing protein [Candidatus Omnitrophota bacterium]
MLRFLKKQSAFSLVEIMVVCFLLSVLMAIAIPAYLSARLDADKQKALYNLFAIYQAQKLYYFEQNPRDYANDITSLSPDYATLSDDDGAWAYSVAGGGGSFVATASHKLPDGTLDGHWLSIDQTGALDETGWPY